MKTTKKKHKNKHGFKLADCVSLIDAIGTKEDFNSNLFYYISTKIMEVRERAISYHVQRNYPQRNPE